MSRGGGGFDMGSVVKWGLLLGGGYYLYRTMTAAPAVTTDATGATTPASSLSLADLVAAIKSAVGGTSTVTQTNTPPSTQTLAQKLTAAAAGDPALVSGTMNADQWNYYRNTIAPPALTAAQFTAAGFDHTTQLTADQFVAKLQAGGLAGVRIPVPLVMNHGGQRVIMWHVAELPQVGGVASDVLTPENDRPRGAYRRLG